MWDDVRFAWRNVWRNTRRSVVTISATALALFVMVIYTGMVSGYLAGMKANIIDLDVGEAQAFAEGYREKPSLYTVIEQPEAMLESLEREGFLVAPRLLGTGLGAGQDNSAGIQMIGIDVARDGRVTKISTALRSGQWLGPDDTGVVLGWRLADNLGLQVGDEFVVLSQGADGSMANEVYPVRGVLGTVGALDRTGVFMTQAAFRELMALERGVHQVILRTPPGVPLDEATAMANGFAPEGTHVSSWRELRPTIASMLDSSEAAMAVMGVIVYLAVGIVILNAMLMAVFERIRELGVLKAIGYPPMRVLLLVLTETAIQTAVALVVGVLLAIPVNAYMTRNGLDLSALGNISVMGVAFDPIWRSHVDLSTYTGPVSTLVVIVGLAVLYPALKAAFIRPLDALRSQ
jgi:ABC-type lipoprotein release transport system permease subunit